MICGILFFFLVELAPRSLCISLSKNELTKIRDEIMQSSIVSEKHHGYSSDSFVNRKFVNYTGEHPVFVVFSKYNQLHIGNGTLKNIGNKY